jgi:ERCC4-type nuclease
MMQIDYREEKSKIPKLLEQLKVPYQLAKLEVGDYAIADVLVERKQINDYLSSLITGHLSQQLYELSYNAELSYLIVEGSVSGALITQKIKREVYLSSLVGSSFKRAPDGKQGQIITVNLETPYDTAFFLKFLYEKVKNDEPRLPTLKKANFSNKDRAIYILSSFPGIGEKRAKALLDKFGTIKNVINANIEDLIQVEGFGKKRASDLFWMVNEKW